MTNKRKGDELMLNQAEEEILKRLAREHAPRVVVNPNHTTPGFDNESARVTEMYVNDQFGRAGQQPMTVQGGQLGKTQSPQIEAEPDWDFIERVKHVMKPNEAPLEFVSRTGLGPARSQQMTKDEITNFIRQSEENALDEIRL
jgi:hypothetical protein